MTNPIEIAENVPNHAFNKKVHPSASENGLPSKLGMR
tara:strand:+ start:515 stop:625 length:111 start_codon:yes stop_codon:yes gene_type:complete